MQYFVSENLSSLLLSAAKGKKEGSYRFGFRGNNEPRRLFEVITDMSCPKMTMPRVSLRFKQLSEEQEERLVALGMEERVVKGKGKLWVGLLTGENAGEMSEFQPIPDAEAMGGTLSMRGLTAINQIIRIITLAGEALDLANDKSIDVPAVGCVEYIGSRTKVMYRSFGSVDLEELSKEEKETNVYISQGSTPVTDVVALRGRRPVHGDAIGDSLFRSQGVFLPFEPNYSAVDKRAIHTLLSDFYSICCEGSDDIDNFDKELVHCWTQEIALTMEGEYIAHMIATLSLAKKTMTMPYFVMVNGIYEGAVLHGGSEFKFKQVGGEEVISMGQTELKADIERYSFHSTTLRSLLVEAKLGPDVTHDKISSMRHLRTIMMGKKEMALSPAQKAAIEQKLLFLNFRERAENVNVSTIKKFLQFVHPTAPAAIPDSVFLDRRSFFSTSRTELALSMFGVYAPSPMSGNISHTLATPPGSSRSISAKPAAIQFSVKELSVAAREWDTCLQNGKVSMSANKIKRGRRFVGNERDELWGLLSSVAGAGLAKEKSVATASKMDLGSEKRKRGEDPDEAEFGVKKAKPAGESLLSLFSAMQQ